jgi:hypothetical protein
MELLGHIRWWLLGAAIIVAALAMARTATAGGNHGIGEGVAAVALFAGASAGFIGRSQHRTTAQRR